MFQNLSVCIMSFPIVFSPVFTSAGFFFLPFLPEYFSCLHFFTFFVLLSTQPSVSWGICFSGNIFNQITEMHIVFSLANYLGKPFLKSFN